MLNLDPKTAKALLADHVAELRFGQTLSAPFTMKQFADVKAKALDIKDETLREESIEYLKKLEKYIHLGILVPRIDSVS